MNKVSSFTAASTFPAKLFHTQVLDNIGRIMPLHVQINPTNVCNLKCTFCSCANRDRDVSMEYREMQKMMTMFKSFGCKAVTITGGGEPLMYKDINNLIAFITMGLNLRAGLVSNGFLLENLDRDAGKRLTWARISVSDEREMPEKQVMRAAERMPNVDWAFSYVLSPKPNIKRLAKAISIANNMRFTHVRIVSDMLDLDHIDDMGKIKMELSNMDLSRVIFQCRKVFTVGHGNCLISLLKPVIDARGDIYPCCGVQYALENPDLDYNKHMRMGRWIDFIDMYNEQKAFDGSKCVKCYYAEYNRALSIITTPLTHGEFI